MAASRAARPSAVAVVGCALPGRATYSGGTPGCRWP